MKQGLELAEKCHNTYYILRNQINQASILSVRGFYGKAESLLKSLNPNEMPYQLKLYYYFTFAWIYNYWESYAQNSDYAKEFRDQKKHFMGLLLQNFNEDSKPTSYYHYLMGENIYLDEPTSNLDPRNQYEMMKLVCQIAREHGITVLVVIHDLNLALRYCNRFLFIKDGEVYDYGDESVVTENALLDVYGINASLITYDNKKLAIIE